MTPCDVWQGGDRVGSGWEWRGESGEEEASERGWQERARGAALRPVRAQPGVRELWAGRCGHRLRGAPTGALRPLPRHTATPPPTRYTTTPDATPPEKMEEMEPAGLQDAPPPTPTPGQTADSTPERQVRSARMLTWGPGIPGW